MDVYLEIGKQKVFAGAINWPGWSRSGRDQTSALQALLDYVPRYARALTSSGLEFLPPTAVPAFTVVERLPGDASTDIGAPGAIPAADQRLFDSAECEHSQRILHACWQTFDDAVHAARGRELRRGPRGGGRDLGKILDHVIGADQSYLRRLAWKYKREGDLVEQLGSSRQAILTALETAVEDGLPKQGPRGGVIWPPPYFVRRVAWHTLDHAWEIEDRLA